MKRDADGEVSIEFGLHMNNGPIEDTQSARNFDTVNSSPKAHHHRHADCKTSVSQDTDLKLEMLALCRDDNL